MGGLGARGARGKTKREALDLGCMWPCPNGLRKSWGRCQVVSPWCFSFFQGGGVVACSGSQLGTQMPSLPITWNQCPREIVQLAWLPTSANMLQVLSTAPSIPAGLGDVVPRYLIIMQPLIRVWTHSLRTQPENEKMLSRKSSLIKGSFTLNQKLFPRRGP